MNRSLLGRIMPLLLGFYALALIAFFLYALFRFSANDHLASMRLGYALFRAISLFVDYLIPIQVAAIAMSASLAARGEAVAGQAQPWNRIVSSTLVVFLLLTAAYTVLFEGFAPVVQKRLTDMTYQTQLARSFKAQAEVAVTANDYRSALDSIDRYLTIDGGNAEMVALRLAYGPRAARQAAPPADTVIAEGAGSAADDAQAYMDKALAAEAEKEWRNANYYAQKAAALDPRRKDALQLAARALDRLNATQADPATSGEQFKLKTAAYLKLQAGDGTGAYYDFLSLAARYPKDADIATYLREATALVKKSSFFLDDARRVQALPGTKNIVFFNAGSRSDAVEREAVSIGTMVELPGGDAYFFDIEAIRYDAAGKVIWHFAAPYGKRDGTSILMRCIDRTDAAVVFLPVYSQGTPSAADRLLLKITPTVAELRALSASRASLAAMGLPELWTNRARLAEFGVPAEALTVDMVMKIVMPFAFLVLSLFAVSLGWAFRARFVGRMPLTSLVLSPIVPVVCALLSLLYLHAHRIVVGVAVLSFGFTTALVVIGAFELAMLALALVFLAGQRAK